MTGVILAGGQNRRFGTDKAFVCYRGKSLIHRTLEVIQAVFQEVIIVTNAPEKYRAESSSTLKDEIPFQGPLGGIVTALRHIGNEGIFVVACDMPLLSSQMILNLVKKDDGSLLVAYEHGGKIEPLCAIYRSALLPLLERRLWMGKRDLHSLCEEEIGIQTVSLKKAQERFLLNMNTPEDLESLNDGTVRILAS